VILGTSGGKRGFLKGGFSLVGFGPSFMGSSHLLGPVGDASGANGLSLFDWDVSTAAKPHIPNEHNAS
jgi:hypothetical protein